MNETSDSSDRLYAAARGTSSFPWESSGENRQKLSNRIYAEVRVSPTGGTRYSSGRLSSRSLYLGPLQREKYCDHGATGRGKQNLHLAKTPPPAPSSLTKLPPERKCSRPPFPSRRATWGGLTAPKTQTQGTTTTPATSSNQRYQTLTATTTTPTCQGSLPPPAPAVFLWLPPFPWGVAAVTPARGSTRASAASTAAAAALPHLQWQLPHRVKILIKPSSERR